MSNGKSRLFNIVLVCSMAINLLLVGGIIGRFAFGPPPPAMPNHLGWIVRTLDKNTRNALRPQLKAHARMVLPLRREIRASQREFEQVLSQPQLDEKKLDAALARLRSASDAYQESMHDEMVVILKKMTFEERQRFVSFLRRRPDEHHEHHRQPQPDSQPDSPPSPGS